MKTLDLDDTVTPDGTPLEVPDTAMLGLGREFATFYSGYLEVPAPFLYFSFLTYLGAAISKMVTLDSALSPEPRLYTVLLGDSADTRKSTALRLADRFFRELGPPWTVPVLFGAGSAEGLAAELAETRDLLLHYDEFKAFVDKSRAEHSVALPMVSTLFERGEYDNRTKEHKVSVRDARISLLAACTRDTYATLFDHQFHAIGFLNRLWLVVAHPTQSIAIPTPIPADEERRLVDRVRTRLMRLDRAYIANGLKPVRYGLTPAAHATFDQWYRARPSSVFSKRLDTYGHRLLVLLAAATDRPEIDDQVAGAVVELLRYQLAARIACDPIDADSNVARMEERIRRFVTGPTPERDLKRGVHVTRAGLWVYNTAIANLETAQEITITTTTTTAGHRHRVFNPVRSVTTSVTTTDGTGNQ
jgi:Protein of unknown function (DUF3987)